MDCRLPDLTSRFLLSEYPFPSSKTTKPGGLTRASLHTFYLIIVYAQVRSFVKFTVERGAFYSPSDSVSALCLSGIFNCGMLASHNIGISYNQNSYLTYLDTSSLAPSFNDSIKRFLALDASVGQCPNWRLLRF